MKISHLEGNYFSEVSYNRRCLQNIVDDLSWTVKGFPLIVRFLGDDQAVEDLEFQRYVFLGATARSTTEIVFD